MSGAERPRALAPGLLSVAVGVALYVLASAWADPYPADANIGAGLLALLGVALVLVGVVTLASALVAGLRGRAGRRR